MTIIVYHPEPCEARFVRNGIYPDASGRMWIVHDIADDGTMRVSTDEYGECTASIDTGTRATVLLPCGFTTIYAEDP